MSTNTKTTLPTRPHTTPEQYAAMTPAQKRAFSKKFAAYSKAFGAQIHKQNAERNAKMIEGIVELIKQNPPVEFEIVRGYLDRNGYALAMDPFPKAKGKKSIKAKP